MARKYQKITQAMIRHKERMLACRNILLTVLSIVLLAFTPLLINLPTSILFIIGLIPLYGIVQLVVSFSKAIAIEKERKAESIKRGGKKVLGMPPERDAMAKALAKAQAKGKKMIDHYLVGYSLETGEPLWVEEEDLCSHACVFAKTGVGKTLWLESLIFQQMARGRASGCTFIDAKRDSGTLAQIILMALVTGRIEDLIVVDPFDSLHSYNFVLTDQRADVKSRKVLRAGLPPTSDQSATKHYDRLASDSICRMVRAMESFGLAWSIHDIAVALSAFNLSYPHLKRLLEQIGARQALVELGHLASSYRDKKGAMDTTKLTENLRGISSELHAISGSSMGGVFCTNYTDLVLTDAILRGKIIYFMLPRLEEAESAARMVKLFREDLEISIGEITSSRIYNLEDPHLVIVDEGSSTFGPTWANLFELARKGRFALLFGAQSTGGLSDAALGLSEAFYERVMANVNLKVMMRIGDNRTAEDMAEWFGKVSVKKTSINTGITKSKSGSAMQPGVDFNARAMGGESQSIGISEDEDYIVSPDELKHEMSAEKGLAWFDLGDGRIIKGRCSWFNSVLPDKWEGREHIVKLEKFERDEIGLGSWVDEQILTQEKADKKNEPFEQKFSMSDVKARKPNTIGNAKGNNVKVVNDVMTELSKAVLPNRSALSLNTEKESNSKEEVSVSKKNATSITKSIVSNVAQNIKDVLKNDTQNKSAFKIDLSSTNKMHGRVQTFAAPPPPEPEKPKEDKKPKKKKGNSTIIKATPQKTENTEEKKKIRKGPFKLGRK